MYDIKKEDILAATHGGLDIILHYYPQAQGSIDRPNVQFKIRDERSASASLKKLADGNYVVTDFGHDSTPRNGIAICMMEEGKTFREALLLLADRYGIGREKGSLNSAKFTQRPANADETKGHYHIEFKNFNDFEFQVLGPKVTQAVVDKYNYKSVKSIEWVSEKENKRFLNRLEPTDTYPIFALDGGTWQKVYQPLNIEKQYRFSYFGEKPKDFIVGLEQLKTAYQKHLNENEEDDSKTKKLPMCIIGSGDRDSLNLAGQGYNVVWFNSETAAITPSMYRSIAACVETVYICPDIDNTGLAAAYALANRFLDLHIIRLPQSLANTKDWRGKPRKDYRDYVDIYPAKYDTDKLINIAMPFKFWKENMNKKTGEVKYTIDESSVLFLLESHGFGQVDDSLKKEGTVYVRNVRNRVSEFQKTRELRTFLLQFIEHNFLSNKIKNALFRSQLDNVFTGLKTLDIDFSDSTETTQYIFFENCSLLISGGSIKIMKPEDVKFPVWEKKVVKHHFKLTDDLFSITKENGEYDIKVNSTASHILDYLINASRIYWREELEQRLDERPEPEREAYRQAHRYNIAGSLLSEYEKTVQKKHLINKIFAIGYLMHSFKSPKKAWAVYATDNLVSFDSESHGRSGKSLCFNSLKKMKNVCFISGKDREASQNAHLFDRVNNQTELIFVDDKDKYQDFNIYYDKITGEMIINPKGAQSVSIDKNKSPKFMFTSNFPIKDDGGSSNGRLLYMLFSDYYHVHAKDDYRETRTVADDFGGKVIFDDSNPEYSPDDWNADYNFFIQCLKFYLSTEDKIDPPSAELSQRKYIEIMGLNFLDWAEDYFSAAAGRLDREIKKIEMIDQCKLSVSLKSSQSFKSKLQAFCEMKGYTLNPPELCDKSGRILRAAGEMVYIKTIQQQPEATITEEQELPF